MQETWSKAALTVQKAPTRKAMEAFIEQQRTIRETRAAVKHQEATRLQVEAKKKSVEKLIQGIAAVRMQEAPM